MALSIKNFHGKHSIDYTQTFKEEVKKAEEFKKSISDQVENEILYFQNYADLMRNVLHRLIAFTKILFCIRHVISNRDPLLSLLPLDCLRTFHKFDHEFAQLDEFDMDSIQDKILELHMSMPTLVDTIIRKRLEVPIVQYQCKLNDVEKKYINCLENLDKQMAFQADEYAYKLYFKTDYYENLRVNEKIYSKQIDELTNKYQFKLQENKNDLEYRQYKFKMRIQDSQLADYIHVMNMEYERNKTRHFAGKFIKSITDERANRLQSLENIKQLYTETLSKDQIKIRHFHETHNKRHKAVEQIIEKFDRDYSMEHDLYERLTNRSAELTNKCNEIQDEIQKFFNENIFVYVLIEIERQAYFERRNQRFATKIQIWWRKILSKRGWYGQRKAAKISNLSAQSRENNKGDNKISSKSVRERISHEKGLRVPVSEATTEEALKLPQLQLHSDPSIRKSVKSETKLSKPTKVKNAKRRTIKK